MTNPERILPIVELRQYDMHAGQRDTLIELFDREFIEPQEATGMQVIGQFRDIDRPDVFTWMRAFDDMPSRERALTAFYDGPVWRRHRDAANATMQCSDNVRLLRPVRIADDFFRAGARPPVGSTETAPGLLVATIYTLAEPTSAAFGRWFQRELAPCLVATSARPLATFETEASVNTFPRLPVREGEHAFVWFARFADEDAYAAHRKHFARELTGGTCSALTRQLAAPVETWRLTPTSRSRLVP